jgi:hypothetical protein
MEMHAIIKGIHSPDILDIDENYQPENKNNFGFLLQLLIGAREEEGYESFDIMVCSPGWLVENRYQDKIIMGRHYLIMFEYDYQRLLNWLNNYVARCTGDTWQQCVEKLSRLGKWEFEDYVENSG